MLAQSSGWHDFGTLQWDLVLCSALAWILVGAALIKGVETSGKVVYFTALFPYAVLIVFAVKGKFETRDCKRLITILSKLPYF